MNRINQLFDSNPRDLLSIYFCAGYPTLEGTTEVIRTLEKHGRIGLDNGNNGMYFASLVKDRFSQRRDASTELFDKLQSLLQLRCPKYQTVLRSRLYIL